MMKQLIIHTHYLTAVYPLISAIMVVMWLCGDIFKTVYFIIRQSPIQFTVCGIIQILVDVAILLQVAVYTRSLSNLID